VCLQHMAAGCLTRPRKSPSTPLPFKQSPASVAMRKFLAIPAPIVTYANTNSFHLQEPRVNLDYINRSQCLSRNPSLHLRHLVNPSRDHRHLVTHKKMAQTNVLTDKVVCLRPPRNRWWRSWWTWDTRRNPLFFDDAASGYTILLSISEAENTGGGSGGGGGRRRA
jgi:hypothetical protein